MKALVSVYDKSGIGKFASTLQSAGIDIFSTGGTYELLSKELIKEVGKVSDLVGFPEILDGRVKTLHPKVHGGLLALRNNPDHIADLKKEGISTIDLVVVNLYPFVETVSREGVTLEDALENIDIGGPTMLRAGAKNFPYVVVVVDPSDYAWVGSKLLGEGLSQDERRKLAQKAFRHVSEYDAAVSSYLAQGGSGMPSDLTLTYSKRQELRYGENPHQRGALYASPSSNGGFPDSTLLHGKELSYNNIMDADSAWRVVSDFKDEAVAIIKHSNPCGLASHFSQPEAYKLAYQGDTVSAFGGIVGFNRNVEKETAEAMKGIFYEVVVAPGYDPEALEVLMRRKNLRILRMPEGNVDHATLDLRPVAGGMLVQDSDTISEDVHSWKTVTERLPTDREMEDMLFAWHAAKHIKSNAIVVVKDKALLGMGAGQPNRVISVRLALEGSPKEKAKGAVLASDAFFPFSDSVETAAEGGVTAIIQPGGSIRDENSIDSANQRGISMVFTGRRHFRH
ncbi:bifunctional phosphoribosylaminoimidazolecarboxamide formyltransferase/IMP cyclohydrolase [SAR202 cluster bacterium AD-804-J14_MRT_500m]|nr:bifunctional phosphoribosylaminoimidazolecarboxamide formyltransferase/IMP cyclohydrolase [SAR202 cluster bacterium AD-804-J14_MRT_500m]